MADCGCASAGVDTRISGGAGITVRGIGTAGSPFIIDSTIKEVGVADSPSLNLEKVGAGIQGHVQLAAVLKVKDTSTVDLTLEGGGTEASPFVLSGGLAGGIDLTSGASGDHLQKKPDGTWGPGPATQVPPGPGLPSTSGVIVGDGTGANPIRLKFNLTYAELEALSA